VVLGLLLEPSAAASTVSRPGRGDERLPLHPAVDGALRVRLLLDAGIAEVFTDGTTGAVALDPVVGTVPLVVSAAEGRAALEGITVFAMPPG
jgi:hypothetical protein